MKFCENVREMSGNFTIHPDEAWIFGPNVFFCLFFFFAKFMKFLALILSEKSEFNLRKSGNLVDHKYTNPEE